MATRFPLPAIVMVALALSVHAQQGTSKRTPVAYFGHATNGLPSGTMVLAPVGLEPPSFSDTGMRVWGSSKEWDVPPPILEHRRHASAVSLNGRTYLVGGYWGPYGEAKDSVEEFDPTAGATGQWNMRQAMYSPRYSFGCCVINGKIYVFGGAPVSGPPGYYTNRAEVYDPVLDVWTELAPMSMERSAPVCAAVGGKAYVIGGTNGSGVLNSVEQYDPDTNTWTTMQPMPGVGRYSAAAAAIDGKIFVTGGDDGSAPGASAPQSQVFCYDPAADHWTQRASMSSPRSIHSAVVFGGELVVIGGEVAYGQLTASIEAYSPVTNSWRSYGELPTARDATASTVLDGSIYVIGGRQPGGQYPSVTLVERLTTRSTELAVLQRD